MGSARCHAERRGLKRSQRRKHVIWVNDKRFARTPEPIADRLRPIASRGSARQKKRLPPTVCIPPRGDGGGVGRLQRQRSVRRYRAARSKSSFAACAAPSASNAPASFLPVTFTARSASRTASPGSRSDSSGDAASSHARSTRAAGAVGRELHGALQMRDRLCLLALPQTRDSGVVVRLRVVGIQTDRFDQV